jgi:Protein of unknown function (DUF2934)
MGRSEEIRCLGLGLQSAPNELKWKGWPGRSSLEERIQRRACELYIVRGNESGSQLDDWLQAEEEIRSAEEAFDEG